jgi:hypothetical protein
MINLAKEPSRKKKFLHSCTEILPNNMPGLLEEEGRVAIRPRSFVIPYAEDCLLNILMSNRRKEKIMRARGETGPTMNDRIIKGNGGFGCTKQLLEILHKDSSHFLRRGANPTMSGHNGWNEIPCVSMIHQCMKKLGASITILKEVALDLLIEKLLFRKLQS